MVEDEIGHFYPIGDNGKKTIAYYWLYKAECNNPTCKSKVPMLKDFYLVNKESKKIYLNPIITNNNITFEIKNGTHQLDAYYHKKKLLCPVCGGITDDKILKKQFNENSPEKIILAVVEETDEGKGYRLPTIDELKIEKAIKRNNNYQEKITANDSRSLWLTLWGVKKWTDMYSNRQLLTMDTFVKNFFKLFINVAFQKEYEIALKLMLAIFIDRIAQQLTSFGLIKPNRETFASPFGRQGIPMVFDFPETNPFCTSSGSAYNQLDWILRYIESESFCEFTSICVNASSGEKNQFSQKSLTCVVTDPPYYDAVPYADISDFFYVWLKRTLIDSFPLNFSTPQTPKSDECTALKHYHSGSTEKANNHFEVKLLQILDSIEHQTSELVCIMFAHQSTKAWTTLCNSILGARMNITGSWTIDTEMTNRNVALAGAALESSVTVSCKPTQRQGQADFKDIKKAIEITVSKEVNELYQLGFRGADLLTACFGQAVSEFGKYERVEKADGSEVTVAELLEIARESAFNALVKGFPADEFTKFYIGWLQLYNFSESDFDDVNRLVKIGLSIETRQLFEQNILIKNGNKQTLASFSARFEINNHLGEQDSSNLIDKAHRVLHLYKSGNRMALLAYISKHGLSSESTFWRLLNSLVEILPQASDDYKVARGLLDNKDSLLREAKATAQPKTEQEKLFS